MTSYVTPKKNSAFIMYIGLPSQASPATFQASPTIASGDFKISKDGGSLSNLTNLPTVTPSSSKMVQLSLTSTEMNADNVTIVCSDAAGAQWSDVIINIQTSARQIDDLAYPATSGRSLAVDISGQVTVGAIANGVIAAATFAANALDAVWSTTTRLLTAGTNIVLAKGTGVTGFNDLDAAGVRTAVGLASANLDTQLSGINSKTTNLPSDPADASDIAAAFVSLASHGDSNWGTATGFATGSDVTTAVSDLEAYGDANWATATGFSTLTEPDVRDAVGLASANLDTQLSSISAPSAADVAAAVWDETLADHSTAGSTGAALAAAGGSGDPWATALPGSYGSGTAGKIIGDALDAAISTRLAAADYTAPPSASDVATAVAAQTLNANIVKVNNVTISGNGTSGTPFGPA